MSRNPKDQSQSSSTNRISSTIPFNRSTAGKQTSKSVSKSSDDEAKALNGHYTKFSTSIFKGNSYLPTFIKEVKDEEFCFECRKCSAQKKNKIILVNNLYIHLSSQGHKAKTPKSELPKLDAALKLFETHNKKDEEKKSQDTKKKDEAGDFLQFVGFLMSLNLSYAQIEKIGKFLQTKAKNKKLGFLKTVNFDQRLLSKISQECFGRFFHDNLLEKLSQNPYSLIVDNSTFCGESICAFKVIFLDKTWDEELKTQITKAQNKIIALTNLKESSSGQTLMEIAEKKLFVNENVRKNMIGFAHDNGSALVGDKIGLAALMKKDGIVFMDLCDPCHGLDLSLKHSIKELPPAILSFVQNISNNFSSSQQKAVLRRIQEEKGLKVLYPKKLAQTRWLSLGQALKRLLEIWESLVYYYDYFLPENLAEETPKNKKRGKKNKINESKLNHQAERTEENIKKMSSLEIKNLLKSELFYLQILLFSESVQVINRYNIRLQDPKLSISGLKLNVHECYNGILDFVIKPELWDMNRSDLFKLDFQDWQVQDKVFMSVEDFVKSISSELSHKFKALESETKELQMEFVYEFYDYFGKILNCLRQYLPLENNLVNILDFVELKDNAVTFKEKLKIFCEEFKLNQSEDEKKQLKDELIQIRNLKTEFYRETSRNVLEMWDRIERIEKLTLIPRLVRFAESLPTSSATIEQSFSNIKLIKTDLRNRLGELSLEGLILSGQEFRSEQKIPINESMISLYEKACQGFYKKTVKSSKIIKENTIPAQKMVSESMEDEYNQTTDRQNHKALEDQNKENSDDNQDLSQEDLYPVKKKTKNL